MSGIFETSTPQIKRYLKREGLKLVENYGNRVVSAAKPLIPRPGASRGFATGALAEIGYVATETGGTKNYDKAVARALEAPGTRIDPFDRDQVLEPVIPVTVSKQVNAIVHYPVDYAIMIHDGFRHVGYQPERWIMGTAFLTSAVNRVEDDYFSAWEMLLLRLDEFTPITQAMRQTRREERWRNANLSQLGAETRRTQAELYNQFKASTESNEFERQAFQVIGVSRSGRAKRRMETGGEKIERLENLYAEWLAARNTGWRGHN
jgi:hypothetical protein